MDQITRIDIKNLACFKALTMAPGASSLLVGVNGSGKSTLLELLFSLHALVSPGGEGFPEFPNYQMGDGNAELLLDISTRKGVFRY